MIGAMMVLTGKWKKTWCLIRRIPDPFMDALNKNGLPWQESFHQKYWIKVSLWIKYSKFRTIDLNIDISSFNTHLHRG